MSIRYTTESFIEKSNTIHNNKYDYSLIEYKDGKSILDIICPIHGIFPQKARYHFLRGCPKCSFENKEKHALGLEGFIKKSKDLHGDLFDYSFVTYVNNNTKITLKCIEHDYIFEQRPAAHFKSKGCPKCVKEFYSEFFRDSYDNFIKKANEKHNNFYIYPENNYVNAHEKVNIICPKHGEFLQTPNNHLTGYGCIKCGIKSSAKKSTKSLEVFIEQSKKIHNNFYDYSLSDYKNCKTKVKILCPIHREFEQAPSSHIKGQGCYFCNGGYSRSDYLKSTPNGSNVYLFKIQTEVESFYKIGISKNVNKRLGDIRRSIKNPNASIRCIHFKFNKDSGKVYDLEKLLHSQYKSFKYIPGISFSGWKECYNLELPTEEIKKIINGISCGKVALDRLGLKSREDYIYYSSEIDKNAIKCSEANHKDINRLGDVSKISYKDGSIFYEDLDTKESKVLYVGKIDLLIGGSPCQTFSSLGLKTGLDGKSGLFYQYLRILNEIKTYNTDLIFLLENVRMRKDYKNNLDTYLNTIGIPICSSLVSYQIRKRIYWANKEFSVPLDKNISFQSYKNTSQDLDQYRLATNRTTNKMWSNGKGDNSISGGCANIFNKNKIYCLTTKQYRCPNSGLIEYKNWCRFLTKEELEQAQTLPIGYTSVLSYNQACAVLGNGWTVDIISHILKDILK